MEIRLTNEQKGICDDAIDFMRKKSYDYSSKLYEKSDMHSALNGKRPIVIERIFWSSYEDDYSLSLKPYLYVVFNFGDYAKSRGGYYQIDDLEQSWRAILGTWEQDAIMWGIIDERTKIELTVKDNDNDNRI